MDDHFLFYLSSREYISDEHVQFSESESRHIVKVLRKRSGEVVQATDGRGHRMKVKLHEVDKKNVTGTVYEKVPVPKEPEKILALGVIKHRERFEFAIEKSVELGVSKIILVHSRYVEKKGIKPLRLEKTIISAMKQSRRCWLPEWEEQDSFTDVMIHYGKERNVVVAHPAGRKKIDADFFSHSSLLMLVGPEGGFSNNEIASAKSFGAQFVNFGESRLRTETAVCVLMSLTLPVRGT